MTILCLGCSYTYGEGVEPYETYPAHLQDITGMKTINAAYRGSDINHAIWTGHTLLNEYKPKIVILQLTSFDRITYCSDGLKNFVLGKTVSENKRYIYDNFEEDSVYKRVYNANAEYHYELLTKATYIESKNKWSLALNHKYKAHTYLYENVCNSDYRFFQTLAAIDMFTKYCQYQGYKVIIFSWLEYPKELTKYLTTPVSVLPSLNDYVIDNGGHINSDGLYNLAKEYLYPIIKDFV